MKRFLTTLAVAPLALTLLGSSAQAEERSPTDTVFDVSRLDTGAAPKLVWTQQAGAKTVIHGHGGTTTIAGDVNAVAPMGSGYVVQTFDTVDPNGRPITRWIGADGKPGRSSWRTGYGLATSPDGKAIAFTVRRGGVKVIDLEGDRVLTMPSIPSKEFGQPVHVSNGYCKEDDTSNGCAVLVNSSRRRVSWIVSSHGIVDTTGFPAISAARGRWAGALTRFMDTGSCSVMTRNLHKKWRTCVNQFSDISPDMQHVLGTPAYADGFGPGDLDVLDLRTGDREHSWNSDRKGTTATYFDEVWEDATHILVVTYQDAEWAIVRLGLDGSMEYAVAPVADDGNMESPFRLQTR
jgi:hypothetical protein